MLGLHAREREALKVKHEGDTMTMITEIVHEVERVTRAKVEAETEPLRDFLVSVSMWIDSDAPDHDKLAGIAELITEVRAATT